MKITAARVIVTCPGRNFVTLKIETDEGITGIGDATLNGRELAVATYLTEHVIPAADRPRPGADRGHLAIPLSRRLLAARTGDDDARSPPSTPRCGTSRARSPACRSTNCSAARAATASWSTGTRTATTSPRRVDEVARYADLGYKAIRAQCGIPGLPSTYGVAKDKLYYEPADAAIPTENVWSTTRYLDHVPKLFDAIRVRFGFEHHLLHDVHHRLTPIEAGRLGRSLEPYRLFWMEDPTPAENQQAFRLIRQHTVTPIAVGEIFNTIFDCQALITEQLIDYIRTTVVHAGGITHLRRIAHLAELYQVRTGSHGATDLSPVCMGAALHFDTWVHNFGVQEYMRHTPETDAVFPHAYWFDDGYLHPGTAPGHGVDIDEALAARYPYKPSALPVNRLEDGTMWNW